MQYHGICHFVMMYFCQSQSKLTFFFLSCKSEMACLSHFKRVKFEILMTQALLFQICYTEEVIDDELNLFYNTGCKSKQVSVLFQSNDSKNDHLLQVFTKTIISLLTAWIQSLLVQCLLFSSPQCSIIYYLVKTMPDRPRLRNCVITTFMKDWLTFFNMS